MVAATAIACHIRTPEQIDREQYTGVCERTLRIGVVNYFVQDLAGKEYLSFG
jgi:hypothetical protein